MRLEVRVTLWVVVLLGAAAAATLGAMRWFQARTLDRQAVESGRLVAMAVRDSLELGMLNNAPDEIRRTVTGLQQGTYVQSVAVYRRDRSVWVGSNHVGSGEVPVEVPEETIARGEVVARSEDGRLSVFLPVVNEPECRGCHGADPGILGAVGVSLDERPLLGELSSSARKSLFIAAIPLLLGVIASVWAVRRGVLRPITMINHAARGLAAGNLATRLPRMRGTEFGELADAFNDMADRLERQAAGLTETVERLREDLEGMEEIQALIASGAGLREILEGTAAHLGRALGASGVAVWRTGERKVEAAWGEPVPRTPAASRGGVATSAGPLEDLREDEPVSWVAVPAARGSRSLGEVRVGWNPPRPLPHPERDLVVSLAGLVAVAIENAELLERFREEEESLQSVLAGTLAAQEEERRRIARELHDDTSQILHALMMNIDLLESHPAAESVRDRLGAVKALAEQAGRNLDKVLMDLRPALLDELGFVAALRWYVSQVREAWGIPVDISVEHVRRLPTHVEVAAFRIAQEAVANAVRHGKPHHITVAVSGSGGRLRIRVRDDGVGFDVAEALARARRGEAVGLLGMRERAELLGGVLRIESTPGAGSTLEAEIPLPPPPAEGREDREREDQRAGG